jgi:hypothetical protein
MNVTGYIEFLLMVAVNKSAYGEIIEKMYHEMQEYLMILDLFDMEAFCLIVLD